MPVPVTRILNFFSGPGAGKSTTKAGTFFLMKSQGVRAVQIEEYATEKSVEEDWATLADQSKVTSEQEKRQRRYLGKVDWVLTDSPLVLGVLYAQGEHATKAFHQEVWDLFDSYQNVNIWLDRVKPYQQYARHHDEDEARELDVRLQKLVFGRIDFVTPGDVLAPQRVMQFLRDRNIVSV